MPIVLYKYLAVFAVVSAVFWGVYRFGYTNAMTKAQAEQVEAIRTALEGVEAKRVADADAVDTVSVKKAKAKVEYRTITKEVIKYVQTNDSVECLNNDGVFIWRTASQGGEPEATPEPTTVLPDNAVSP